MAEKLFYYLLALFAPKNRLQKKKNLKINNLRRCHRGSYPRSRQFESVHRHQNSANRSARLHRFPL